MRACGRLDGIASLLPDPDLLLYELDEAPRVQFDDVAAVSNYVAACELGVLLLADGLPISTRLLLQIRGRDDSLPALLRAALVHVQFETIHPFLDGNAGLGVC
jgi:Fic/DOC family